ncbi:MAG: hypothetical protein ACI8XO_000233 [Verrucomicrobiales bacterium]|jgi:hypothetical protein
MFNYKLMARKFTLALGLIVLCSLTISGARKPQLGISFHLEGSQSDGAKMVQPMRLGNPPKTYYFRRAPEMSKRHIKGYYPFPANDGSGFGVAFKLNQNGTDALTTVSTVAQGRKLLTVIDSEPVDFIVLNEPIHDGYIVVWGGLTKADLAKFDKEFPRIQPSKSNTQSLIPERATSREETREAPPIRVEESGTEEPNKKRKRLFNFGSSKKDS